jgi:hypothetical protein
MERRYCDIQGHDDEWPFLFRAAKVQSYIQFLLNDQNALPEKDASISLSIARRKQRANPGPSLERRGYAPAA